MQLERKGLSFVSRLPAVHFAVCGLAILGAGLVQINWDAALSVRAVAVVVAATGWLLATAWLHRELGRRGQRRLVLLANDARMNLLGDSVLAGVALAILWRGHESPLAVDGVWSICPAVLSVGALSAAALMLGRADLAAPSRLGPQLRLLVRGRALVAGVLILVLAILSVWPTSVTRYIPPTTAN